MGAVVSSGRRSAPFTEMRNGPSHFASSILARCVTCRSWLLLLLAIQICLTTPLHSQAPRNLLQPPQATPAPEKPASPPSPPPVQTVPLAQIADQAEVLDGLLREMSQDLEAVSARMVSRVEAKAEE